MTTLASGFAAQDEDVVEAYRLGKYDNSNQHSKDLILCDVVEAYRLGKYDNS